MAKRTKESVPESGLVTVVDPSYDAPVEAEVRNEFPPPPSGPTFGQRVRRFFEFLLRLVSWFIILGVLAGALYFGLPLLYQRFVVPVEQNTVQVGELQDRQKQLEQQVADLQEQLNVLETGQTQNVEALNELDERVVQVESSIESNTRSLAALEEMQGELEKQDASTTAELQRQVDLMKSMELLSRARLYMYQSNFGLARQDAQSARDLLETVDPGENTSLAKDVDAVIRRLDLVLNNLPSFPVAASDDLDIAWQILVSGLPTSAASPTPALEPTPTPPATLVPTTTP